MGLTRRSSNSACASAIEAWRSVLGCDRVLDRPEDLSQLERRTIPSTTPIVAALRPSKASEIPAVVAIARRYRVPLYPISRGRNWGLGSMSPVTSDCALLDLRRLDRILDFDEELGTITVEPGVSFEAAAEFLRRRESTRYVPVIGGPPDASLIGNMIERGDALGPYGERFAHMCSMDVVLGTGATIRTGFRRFGSPKVSALHRWGVGPALDGLFTQSNFGIVVASTLWLPRLPRDFRMAFFGLRTDRHLRECLPRLRGLMEHGIVAPNSLAIWSLEKLVSSEHASPLTEGRRRTPIAPEVLRQLAGPWKRAKWVGLVGLYSPSSDHGRLTVRTLRRQIAPMSVRFITLDRFKARWARRCAPLLSRLLSWDVEDALRTAFFESVFLGYPTRTSLRGMYWGKRRPASGDMNPDRDGCGVSWLCPTVPFTSNDLDEALTTCRRILWEHGFDPCLAVTFPSPRCAYLLPSILFDKDDSHDEEQATSCHDALFSEFVRRGYLPHRLGVQSMRGLPRLSSADRALHSGLARLFDPDRILAPGRYDFGGP